MKAIFLILSIFTCLYIQGQEIILVHNKSEMKDTPCLVGTGTYYCTRKDGKVANWKLYTIFSDGYYKKLMEEQSSKEFKFIPELVVNFYPEPQKIIYRGKQLFGGAIISDNGVKKDTLNFYFDLLPTKPMIKSIELNYDFFKDFDFINPQYKIVFEAQNFKEIIAYHVEDESFDTMNSLMNYTSDLKSNWIDDNLYEASEPNWAWNEDIFFYTTNHFGSSLPSDTIYVNDYIDSKINKKMIDFYNQYNNIELPSIDCDIKVINKNILFNQTIPEITMFDISGHIVKKEENTNHINNIESLPKGLYIIKMKLYNKLLTKKISL